MVFDGSAWYGNPRFSDVTIKFSGRELKAHKLVLCSRSKYFQRALGEDGAFMESKRNVIELHDDDPTALETTIRWLYTGNLHSDNPNLTWQPSIEVLITADKYSLTDLSLQVLTHLELRDCFTFVSPSHLQHAVSRAADFSDTGGRMQKILFDICDKHFRECFDDAAFRDWLETMPWLRDRLYKRHIAWLARHTAFRAKLRKGGEFALDVVDCLLELLQRPAERGRFGSEPLRVRAVRPRPRDARHPYLPTFAG